MTFNDIFKSGFLENVNSVSILDMAVALILSFGIVLMLLSNTVMNVGESLVKVLAQVFQKTFGFY